MRSVVRIMVAAALAVGSFLGGAIAVTRGGAGTDAPVAAVVPDAAALTGPAVVAAGSLDATIVALQERLRGRPDDAGAFAALGLAYVQQGRVSADPSWYPKADEALDRSLALAPEDHGTLVGLASLAAARHDFAEALRYGERARELNPDDGAVYGVIGDALLELGRYDAAFDAFQTMVDTEPGLASYARVSYARELTGDVDGAIAAMRTAQAFAASQADASWAASHVGELEFRRGDVGAAARDFRVGAGLDPQAVLPLVGLAKVEWARGDLDGAIDGLEDVVARFPAAEYVWMLGDLQAVTGDDEAADRAYDLVRLQSELSAASGVNTDLELALFEAEHGDPAEALRTARAEWARRQSVHVADALAWSLHANGRDDEAARYARRALALGTTNGLFMYHAGAIELARGRSATAERLLSRALEVDPYFSVLGSLDAARLLAEARRA